MQHSHRLAAASDPLPPRFVSWLTGFLDLFTRPTWSNVLVLLAGVVLAPGRRTVTTALRILGRDHDPDFCTFHRIARLRQSNSLPPSAIMSASSPVCASMPICSIS